MIRAVIALVLSVCLSETASAKLLGRVTEHGVLDDISRAVLSILTKNDIYNSHEEQVLSDLADFVSDRLYRDAESSVKKDIYVKEIKNAIERGIDNAARARVESKVSLANDIAGRILHQPSIFKLWEQIRSDRHSWLDTAQLRPADMLLYFVYLPEDVHAKAFAANWLMRHELTDPFFLMEKMLNHDAFKRLTKNDASTLFKIWKNILLIAYRNELVSRDFWLQSQGLALRFVQHEGFKELILKEPRFANLMIMETRAYDYPLGASVEPSADLQSFLDSDLVIKNPHKAKLYSILLDWASKDPVLAKTLGFTGEKFVNDLTRNLRVSSSIQISYLNQRLAEIIDLRSPLAHYDEVQALGKRLSFLIEAFRSEIPFRRTSIEKSEAILLTRNLLQQFYNSNDPSNVYTNMTKVTFQKEFAPYLYGWISFSQEYFIASGFREPIHVWLSRNTFRALKVRALLALKDCSIMDGTSSSGM